MDNGGLMMSQGNAREVSPKILFAVLVFFIFFGVMVQGAVLDVTTNQDSVLGSLRAAITEASNNNEDDTINLPAGIYILQGTADEDNNAGGDLDIDTIHSITIMGQGAGTTIIDSNQGDRVLHILKGTVYVSAVTIRNGKTSDSNQTLGNAHGGGIYNNGNLTLSNCTIRKNVTRDGIYCGWNYVGHGGGIYNSGTLKLENCTIKDNTTGIGESCYIHGAGGYIGGCGGGIYNTGQLSLTNCIVKSNQTGRGGSGNYGASGGRGGGIYNRSTLSVTNCTITANITGNGGSGGITSGGGGDGGGIYNCSQGQTTVNNSTISTNITGDGAVTGLGGTGSGGNGGGVCNVEEGTITFINCTISDNTTGNGSDSTFSDAGHGGSGGGIFNNKTMNLTNCTISNNNTGTGGKVIGDDSPDSKDGKGGNGGGICSSTGTASVKNTIIANNQVAPTGEAPDFWGTLNSIGYNLIENTEQCGINGVVTGNITGKDPLLGGLADNGGPAQTCALLPGSPAIDAGNSTGISEDQRGYPRPIDIPGIDNVSDAADIGAFEYNSYSPAQISLNRTELSFGADSAGNQTSAQSVLITNSGGGILNWSISDNTQWLYCTPISGTGPAVFNVSISRSGLAPGTYSSTIAVEATNAINSPQFINVTLIVYPHGAVHLPFGCFDTPIDGSTVMSSISVSGWVLDNIGIEYVKISRKPAAGEGSGLVYIGSAVLVEGARPDVEAAYPDYPVNYKAGWGYNLLTNGLPNQGNGTFTIYAKAADKEGNIITLGTKTIKCDNINVKKPFGAIDTPEQGGTASGRSYVNFGWALTPLPNTIPKDGSTITVWVDGVPKGHPVYNHYRNDIAVLFPGYNNSAGAGGHFYLDTLRDENGVHTIAWSVKDDAGNIDGIGSRYFNIQNTNGTTSVSQNRPAVFKGESSMLNADITQIPPDDVVPIYVKRGYNLSGAQKMIYPDESGKITIEIRELERIEIHFPEPGLSDEPRRLNIFPLPIGAVVDQKKGIFYWQPGPGYIGSYELEVIEQIGDEVKQRLITIGIKPRFE